MPPCAVEWKRSALKELRQCPKETRRRVLEAVERLSEDPYRQGTRKLAGRPDSRRFRVGDYRVIYTVHNDQLVIQVVRVGHRKDVYRR